MLHDKYRVRHIGIQDDNFNPQKKRTIEICKGIIERGLELTIRADSGGYAGNIDEETLHWLKKAGFKELYFGVESGNQIVLEKVINKKLDLRKVKSIVQISKTIGISPGGYFMVGVPGETKKTMGDTVRFAATSGFDRVRLYICQPFPESRMYEDCKKNGWLSKDFEPKKSVDI